MIFSRNPFHLSWSHPTTHQFLILNILASSSTSSFQHNLGLPLFLLWKVCASNIFLLISWSSSLITWPAHLSLVNLMCWSLHLWREHIDQIMPISSDAVFTYQTLYSAQDFPFKALYSIFIIFIDGPYFNTGLIRVLYIFRPNLDSTQLFIFCSSLK